MKYILAAAKLKCSANLLRKYKLEIKTIVSNKKDYLALMRVKYCQLITSVLARQAWMLCLQYKHCCRLFDYF